MRTALDRDLNQIRSSGQRTTAEVLLNGLLVPRGSGLVSSFFRVGWTYWGDSQTPTFRRPWMDGNGPTVPRKWVSSISCFEQACELALGYGAFYLRTIRTLIERQAPQQELLPFVSDHPLVRPMSEYGQFVHDAFQFRNTRE